MRKSLEAVVYVAFGFCLYFICEHYILYAIDGPAEGLLNELSHAVGDFLLAAAATLGMIWLLYNGSWLANLGCKGTIASTIVYGILSTVCNETVWYLQLSVLVIITCLIFVTLPSSDGNGNWLAADVFVLTPIFASLILLQCYCMLQGTYSSQEVVDLFSIYYLPLMSFIIVIVACYCVEHVRKS